MCDLNFGSHDEDLFELIDGEDFLGSRTHDAAVVLLGLLRQRLQAFQVRNIHAQEVLARRP